MAEVDTKLPRHASTRPIHDVVDVEALFDVEVVSRSGRTDISEGVETTILTYLKQWNATTRDAGKSELNSEIPPAIYRKLRSEVFTEHAARVVELQTIEDCWRESVIVAEQDLLGITEDSRAAVHVAAEVAHTDCGRQCVAKVPSVGICELMIDAHRVARLVLSDLPVDDTVSQKPVVHEVSGAGWLKFQQLGGDRIYERLRDHVQSVDDGRVCGALWLTINQYHALRRCRAKLTEPATAGQNDWDQPAVVERVLLIDR